MVRLIGRIARTELLIMFCSPMGWVLVVAFAVHSSIIYFRVLDLPLYHKMQGYEGIYPLTESIFTQAYAVCWQITQVMFLYVPLLTMGLISREVANGSIRLLMSSPVRTSEMVIGKFLAVAAYCLVFALILLALLAANVFVVENIDIAPVLVAIFGVYILTCTYGAIGLFMSSLTQYQLAAAMYTFAALALLMFIGSIGQETPFLQDFNYWISLTGRVDYFRNGLIVSKHLAYFLIIIGVFIFLTITKLSASQSTRPVHINIAKVAAVIIIAVTLACFIHENCSDRDYTLPMVSS